RWASRWIVTIVGMPVPASGVHPAPVQMTEVAARSAAAGHEGVDRAPGSRGDLGVFDEAGQGVGTEHDAVQLERDLVRVDVRAEVSLVDRDAGRGREVVEPVAH